ncbi:MAG TPA: DNA polymerase IV, partial [Oscillospiraceae bacterium]|nr:DNA polymerase IV [Oscillospiraceae bacterium]
MERIVLHVDCNKFYASVECLHRPEIRNLPVIVGGDESLRHGIVLTKNEIAARYSIKTGEAIWQARQKCPNLVVVPPNYPLYMRFSNLAREIYCDYTDLVEPYGLDECWLDVTGSGIFGSGREIAELIRRRVKKEL